MHNVRDMAQHAMNALHTELIGWNIKLFMHIIFQHWQWTDKWTQMWVLGHKEPFILCGQEMCAIHYKHYRALCTLLSEMILIENAVIYLCLFKPIQHIKDQILIAHYISGYIPGPFHRMHRKVSNISHTKCQNLNVSRLGLQLSLHNILKPNVQRRKKI